MSNDEVPLRVLGIPGSLRHGSFNLRLLELARRVAPPSLRLTIYEELGSLPLFNEDLEGSAGAPPEPVLRLRLAIANSDAVLIATPEYNQSMPGVLKNAVDWLSRPAPRSAFTRKRVALCGVTTGEWGTRLSQAALRQTLLSTGATLVPLQLYLRRAKELFADGPQEQVEAQIREYMAALARELGATTA